MACSHARCCCPVKLMYAVAFGPYINIRTQCPPPEIAAGCADAVPSSGSAGRLTVVVGQVSMGIRRKSYQS